MSEQTSTELVMPTTGELVALEDPEQCARLLLEIRDLEGRLRAMKSALRETLFEHSRSYGSKTLHFGPVTATITTPTTIIWDMDVLHELVEAGLSQERFDELVTAEVTYKVNQSVAKSISGSNDEYAEIIERAQTKIKKEPSVSIKSTKGALYE